MTMKKAITMSLAMLLVMMSFAGCSSSSTSETSTIPTEEADTESSSTEAESTTADSADADTNTSYAEAPMLSEMVSAGTIPTVEERIPSEEDVMVENLESVGTYGGAFSFAYTEAGWSTGKPIEQGLFRFTEDGTVEPNVAQAYEVNDDATVYTIYLREGMKWSDGEDFTAADCVFFYDHMCVPEVFGKSLWDCFKVTDPDTGEETIAEFEQIDDTTFTVTFQYPKAQFIENLAINAKWCYAPQHYMEQMLPEFIGEEAALEKAEEMGYSDVASMCKNIGYYFWNVPGVPTLNPYVLSTEDGKSDVDGEYYEFVRNPYYWKVDQEGNQLPYVDTIEVTKISDESQGLIKLLAGELTISTVDWKDIETVQENAESVGYQIVQWQNSSWADLASQLQLNQTVEDEELRELFQSKEFREALSICVDREEYSKLVSDGWSEAKQASPPEGTLGASEEWDQKWTEYDPDQAKELLEGLGLVMGSDGYYAFADGKELVLNITSFTDSGSDDTYPVLKQYFDAVGINSTYQPVDKDLLNNRLTTNDFEVVLGPVAPAESVSIILRPDTLVPVRNYAAWYGQIGNWYASGGEEGYEPTGDLLELLNLYDELKTTTDTKEQQEIGLEMLQLHEDNMWVIGYMGAATTLITVDQNLMNFKEDSVFSDEYRGLGIAHIDTCYFAE